MSDVRVIVPVDVELAHTIGIPDTFLVTQIDYWTRRVYAKEPEKYGDHYIDGRWWVYNTVKDWKEQFKDMFSKNTIIRALDRLEDSGLVYTGVFNKMGRDRTKWYSVNYETLFSKFPYTKQIFSDEGFPITQNGEMTITQSGEMQLPKMGKALPKNTTNNSVPKKDNSMEFFRKKNSACLTPTELSELVVTVYTEEHREDANEAEKLVLSEIALYFGERYQTVTGRKHPCISKQAAVRAVGNLLCSEIEVKYGERICTEEWNLLDHAVVDVYGMIDKYFQTQFAEGTEYSFSHFCSNGVLVRKWLEYRRESYTYYSDSELLPY